MASLDDMYLFEDGLGIVLPPKVFEEELAVALGSPDVLKRGAVAINTESSGG